MEALWPNVYYGTGCLTLGLLLLLWFARGLRRGDEAGSFYESVPRLIVANMVLLSAGVLLAVGIGLLCGALYFWLRWIR